MVVKNGEGHLLEVTLGSWLRQALDEDLGDVLRRVAVSATAKGTEYKTPDTVTFGCREHRPYFAARAVFKRRHKRLLSITPPSTARAMIGSARDHSDWPGLHEVRVTSVFTPSEYEDCW